MIGYVTLGTNDLPRAAAFYDELLALLGGARMMQEDNFVGWSGGNEAAAGLAVTRPFDGAAATVGNGTMVALAAESPAQCDAVHAKALALGGSDEGAPGARDMPGFYAGYFRDLDGNKLNVFCFTGSK
jgi:catechol 2,3-dioxygenase-like lactoylglutathione lyase family enzyme